MKTHGHGFYFLTKCCDKSIKKKFIIGFYRDQFIV